MTSAPSAGRPSLDDRRRARDPGDVPPLQEIDGLDLEEALLCVPGEDLLAELLVEFDRQWRDGATRISAALAAHQPHEAQRIAHALAGVAATLALSRVARSARLVEGLLDARDAKSAATEVAALAAALDRATSSIRSALGTP